MISANAKYCKINELSNEECSQYLKFQNPNQNKWLLGFLKGGILWGYFNNKNEKWELSDTKRATLIDTDLIDIRFFSEDSEVLIWRDEKGFKGRLLQDTEDHPKKDDPLRPNTEKRILFGDRLVKCSDNFSTVSDKRGAQQTLPIVCNDIDFEKGRMPLRLDVKNYFAQCPDSGVVKNVVSRLCRVFKENGNG
jgi:CRISPR-associated protein (TIGR03984 family)